jgi:hypothetical protein
MDANGNKKHGNLDMTRRDDSSDEDSYLLETTRNTTGGRHYQVQNPRRFMKIYIFILSLSRRKWFRSIRIHFTLGYTIMIEGIWWRIRT